MSSSRCFLIHEGIVYASLFGVTFSILYVFGDFFLPFNHYFVIRQWHRLQKYAEWKKKQGVRQTVEFFKNRKK
jgi:hypothetical protein